MEIFLGNIKGLLRLAIVNLKTRRHDCVFPQLIHFKSVRAGTE